MHYFIDDEYASLALWVFHVVITDEYGMQTIGTGQCQNEKWLLICDLDNNAYVHLVSIQRNKNNKTYIFYLFNKLYL